LDHNRKYKINVGDPSEVKFLTTIRQSEQTATEAHAQVSFHNPALSPSGALDFCFNKSKRIFGRMFVLAGKKEKGILHHKWK
jgi:hypothetical protein